VNRYSILQEEKKCYVCGNRNVHIHEVYYGSKNRSKSIEDGCCIYLCPRHHNMSKEGIHFNKDLDQKVKQSMERRWLEKYDKTIEDFIKRYGRNYI
jgi:hypothetical protein